MHGGSALREGELVLVERVNAAKARHRKDGTKNPKCEMKIPKSARHRSHEKQKNPKPSSFFRKLLRHPNDRRHVAHGNRAWTKRAVFPACAAFIFVPALFSILNVREQ